MPLWTWILTGAATALGLSLLVGLSVAAVLGSIAREASELISLEPWASAPLMRDPESNEEVSVEGVSVEGVPSSRGRS
jgi:hypothetical protein